MTFEEILQIPYPSNIPQEDIDFWNTMSYAAQMQEIYGEAYHVIKQYQKDTKNVAPAWQKFAEYCNRTYNCPDVSKAEKETLRIAQFEIYDFVFGDNTLQNTGETVLRWFEQWVNGYNWDLLEKGAW